jgi:hypothetical protein
MPKIESVSGSISQRHGSADPGPDPHQNVMDPLHWCLRIQDCASGLKIHKIENFFDSDFGICVISLLVMHK